MVQNLRLFQSAFCSNPKSAQFLFMEGRSSYSVSVTIPTFCWNFNLTQFLFMGCELKSASISFFKSNLNSYLWVLVDPSVPISAFVQILTQFLFMGVGGSCSVSISNFCSNSNPTQFLFMGERCPILFLLFVVIPTQLNSHLWGWVCLVLHLHLLLKSKPSSVPLYWTVGLLCFHFCFFVKIQIQLNSYSWRSYSALIFIPTSCSNPNTIQFLFKEGQSCQSYSVSVSFFFCSNSNSTKFLFMGRWSGLYLLHFFFLLKSKHNSYLWRKGGPTLSLSPLFVQNPIQLNSYLWGEVGPILSLSPLSV